MAAQPARPDNGYGSMRDYVISDDDFDVQASRAVEPMFYRAPTPERDDLQAKEYQHAAVEYAVARDNVLIGDAPGVGKTAEAIMLDNAIESKSTLVVCPASLRLNWRREIWLWSTRDNTHVECVLNGAKGVNIHAGWVVISYDLLRNESLLAAIMSQRWDHMVLDEAHYLKDPKGNKRTKVLCAPDRLPSVVGRITMLSGTILPNQPKECYNAVRLLDWEAINNASLEDFEAFYYEAGGGMIRGPVFDPVRQVWANKVHWSDKVRNVPRRLDDLQFRLRKRVMVRRIKEQVLHELPEKQWHPFPLPLDADTRAALRHPGWIKAQKLYELDPDSFDRMATIDGEIATARRMLGEAKVPALVSYIEDLISGGVDKLVIAAWHLSVLAELRSRLQWRGLVYMDGSTSPARKQQAVDQFQNDPSIKIILGQMLPLAEGWTLTAAQDAVLAEIDWVPGKNDQFVDRIHRLGQRGSYILAHVPLVPGSLDERIFGSVVAKDQHIYKALDAPLGRE